MNVLTLAHYYTDPDVQEMADYVGDSLELSLIAQREHADRIVFAGVRFMAETAKIVSPHAEVILPDAQATCSLVEQTDIKELKKWREQYHDHVHVSYINSSAEHKTLSDWIVTSRNVDDVIAHLYAQGEKVIFSPDRNMGAYLNYQYGYNMPVWSAVCEVHDKFREDQVEAVLAQRKDGKTIHLISHPESPLPVLLKSDFVGSTKQMLEWVDKVQDASAIVYVATEQGLIYNMRKQRPDLAIEQLPMYTGCQCNVCPYMKRNTLETVTRAQQGIGVVIDYLNEDTIHKARQPIERMLAFNKRDRMSRPQSPVMAKR